MASRFLVLKILTYVFSIRKIVWSRVLSFLAPQIVRRRAGSCLMGRQSPDLKPSSLPLQNVNFLQVCQYNQNVVAYQSKLVKVLQFACRKFEFGPRAARCVNTSGAPRVDERA